LTSSFSQRRITQVACFQTELKLFKEAATAARTYPGALPAEYCHLKQLWGFYRRKKSRFDGRTLQVIQQLEEGLPQHIDLVCCPLCNGSGTRGWMAYKHTCSRCGGWKRVQKTPEAVHELEWTWGACA
jgi:hypothetical protein